MMNHSNNNNGQFNAAPILLRHPSSFMIDNENMTYQGNAKSAYHSSSPEPDTIIDDVPQRLEPEQYQYEFPPKSHLQALSVQLDQSLEDSLSFFDASSFTTMSSTCSSRVSSVLTDEFNAQEDQEFNSFLATLEQEQQANGFSLSPPPVQTNLVLDRQLSPLQLPQQVQDMTTRLREESYDSISTITQPIVAPSSFLTRSVPQEQIEWHDTFGSQAPLWQDDMDYHYDSIHPHHRLSDVDQDIPVIRRPSENVLSDSSSVMDDDSSQFSHDSKVIFIKLNKKNKVASPYIPKRSTTSQSDEGYDDNSYIIEEDEKEMQSDSVFLPLGRQEEDEDSLQRQIDQLQAQVREEKAMRLAFEKAMEEMVLLMDQQQKMLYDRVEQEVSMRQVYEKKMEEALAMVAPLESKLKKETDARCELESMMSHVLGELQELKLAHKSSSRPSSKTTTTLVTRPNDNKKQPSTTTYRLPKSSLTRPTTTTTTTSSRQSTRPSSRFTSSSQSSTRHTLLQH